MSKYRKYGRWFAMAVGVSGILLLVILAVLGVPIWLAFILAIIGAVPGAIALGVFGAYAWLESGPLPGEKAAAERIEQARQGKLFMERSRQGRPRRKR